MIKGKLIVIEGTDGCGKQTQSILLEQNLSKLGYKVKRISFPNYDSNASYPVKMYLAGEFGNNDSVNVYASSSFFAVDRYASFKKEWEKDLKDGLIVICDRYTLSNLIHQANRITDENEFNEYNKWLIDLEWNKFKLPIPDLTIFLDVPYEISNNLIKDRINKATGNYKKDILESDENQKIKAYNMAKKISKLYNLSEINCVKDNSILPINEIQDKIIKLVTEEILCKF